MRFTSRSRRSRRRSGPTRESGQALVIFVLFLPVLIGFCALVLDVGNLYAQKRFVQNAADAAVLAGAQNLPDSGAAQSQAQSYVTKNGGGSVVVSFPDPNKIHAQVTRSVPTYFAKLFGITTVNVVAKATASRAASGPAALLYAHSTTQCDALHISGSGNRFYGAIWSNYGVNESGSNWGTPNIDPAKDGNATLYYNQTIDTAKCLTTKPTWQATTPQPSRDWPVALPTLTCSNGSTGTTCPTGTTHATSVNGVSCTYVGDKFTVTTPPAAGIHILCADTKISVNKTGMTVNNVAYVAPNITWSSGNNSLTGYTGLYAQYGGLLFDAYDTGGLNQSGSGNSFTGAIFAPTGNAQISGGGSVSPCAGGGNAAACGFIEGETVQMSGGNGIWRGLGPGIGNSGGVSLSE